MAESQRLRVELQQLRERAKANEPRRLDARSELVARYEAMLAAQAAGLPVVAGRTGGGAFTASAGTCTGAAGGWPSAAADAGGWPLAAAAAPCTGAGRWSTARTPRWCGGRRASSATSRRGRTPR